MKKIPLTQGASAIVDDEDFLFLLGFKWCLHKEVLSSYALTTIDGRPVKMHWLILPTNKPLVVDHIDGNGLNNQRLNLRRVTQSQNAQNRRKPRNCNSKYKGVFLNKRLGKWGGQIQVDSNRKKRKFLGHFDKEVDAAIAYDIAAKQHFGEYARLNFNGGTP